MKNYILFFISLILFSCSNKKKQVDNSLIIKESKVIDQVVPEGIQKQNPLTACSELGAYFEKRLQDALIDRNVLKSEQHNIKVVRSELSKDCRNYTLVFKWSQNIDNLQIGEVKLIEEITDFKLQILEFDEFSNTIKVKSIKSSESEYVNEYGSRFKEDNTNDDLFEISMDTQKAIDLDKVSIMYSIGLGRKLNRDDLEQFSISDLQYLRNEFYARKGYQFKTSKMQTYFKAKDWYVATKTSLNGLLNERQLANVFFIKSMEEELKLRKNASIISIIDQLWEKGTQKLLSKEELNMLNIHQLSYLRNQFFAKKGYTFTSRRLAAYFNEQDWYIPSRQNVDDLITSIEQENITLIRQIENEN